MVAHAIGGSALWQTKPDPQATRKEETAESVTKLKAETALAEERKAVLKLLGLPAHGHSVVRPNGDDYRVVEFFAALVKLTDDEVMRVLALVMAATLESGTAAVEALGTHLKVDMRDYWQADDAFFDLLRNKGAVNAILRHIGGKAVAGANVSATTKVQKNIVRDFITGDGRTKVEGWLPRYMEFPFKAYTKAGGGRLTENTARVKSFVSRNRRRAEAALSPEREGCERSLPINRNQRNAPAPGSAGASSLLGVRINGSPSRIIRIRKRLGFGYPDRALNFGSGERHRR